MLNMLNKIFRVFKFSQHPAQVTGYFKHLPLEVLFAFQILLTTQFCFTKWSWSDLFEEINKCQLMKIVIKQCVYYITFWSSKRELFLWESLLVYTDCHLNVHVSAQRQICSHVKVSTWKRDSKGCCLSFQLPRSLEDKQVTIILGIRVNKYYMLFQFWKWR